ncbi:hypothetical protein CKO12_09875 [Chromatium okenii]|uniref:YggT family protein n=1 Tax=Chromatium okenii TaxID=61644 RepID=UPI001903E487|nr:YggT family protein [Chromatium okenii]MBK1642180.1 hypothetical protein [Chromatium okenii]
MSSSYLITPLVFLIQTLFGLYAAIVAMRFLLQWARADFHNPVSQFIVKATSPVLRPLRQFIPGYQGIDVASLVLIWLLTTVELALLALLHGLLPFGAIGWAIPSTVELFINLFLFTILLRVVLSWLNPDPYNPMVILLTQLTDPLLRPAQRQIPVFSGVDFSPMLVLIGLTLLNMLLIPPLNWLVGNPF